MQGVTLEAITVSYKHTLILDLTKTLAKSMKGEM